MRAWLDARANRVDGARRHAAGCGPGCPADTPGDGRQASELLEPLELEPELELELVPEERLSVR